jgi:hypothetical protein
LVSGSKRGGLHAHDFLLHSLTTTQQVQTGPGQQTRHGVEIRAEGFAADARSLDSAQFLPGDGRSVFAGIDWRL